MMDVHWRNTQKPARLFFMDARVSAMFLLFMVHARMWTFMLVVLSVLAMWALERRGLTFEAALRAIRSWMVGPIRPANLSRARRKWTDYGG